jgi:hypothetical protein
MARARNGACAAQRVLRLGSGVVLHRIGARLLFVISQDWTMFFAAYQAHCYGERRVSNKTAARRVSSAVRFAAGQHEPQSN